MATLDDASLSAAERRVLERFAEVLGQRLGDDLRSVWLYGSRARGERPAPESDVDVIVILRGGRFTDDRVWRALHDAAEDVGGDEYVFSIHVYTPEHVAQRRQIRSFFIQEVDRDKIVLVGEP